MNFRFSTLHDEYVRVYKDSTYSPDNFVLAISSQSEKYPGLYLSEFTKYKIVGVDDV